MKKKSGLGFFGWFFIFMTIANVTLGAWSVIEILSWFHKSIPLAGSIVIGLFTGEVSFPIAIIGKILRCFGVF